MMVAQSYLAGIGGGRSGGRVAWQRARATGSRGKWVGLDDVKNYNRETSAAQVIVVLCCVVLCCCGLEGDSLSQPLNLSEKLLLLFLFLFSFSYHSRQGLASNRQPQAYFSLFE
jgi:hypothetical protein